MTNRPAALVLLAVLLALPAAARASPPHHAPGEVLVKFRDGTSSGRSASAMAAHAHLPLAALDDGWTRVRIRPGETVEAAMAGYVDDPAVEWVQPNYVYRASRVPNESTSGLYGEQWALRNTGQAVTSAHLQAGEGLFGTNNPPPPSALVRDIEAEQAWDLVTDCSSVVVAVVDTGVNYTHQDLAANMWNDPGGVFTLHGADFVDNDSNPMDEAGHGTHVAGIIAAQGNNGVGTSGVCWRARIMAVRVLDATGSGFTSDIIRGIAFARDHGASVINMSLGGSAPDPAYQSAIDGAIAAGVVVVVAAGNDGANNDTTPTYPCAFTSPGLVCVAALDQDFGLASFSNYGARTVDVGAPGTNILATWPGTHTETVDSYASGWTFSPSGGTGWGTGVLTTSSGSVTVLTDPSNWVNSSTATYPASADHRAYKTFDTTGGDVVTVELFASIDVSLGDLVRAACRTGGGDPFGAGGVVVNEVSDLQTVGDFVPLGFNVSACKNVTTSIGFQLAAVPPSSPRDFGVAASPLSLKKLTWNTSSYNTIAGTSMATPVVAGIAALVRAYQPAFTPADVAGAIRGGGHDVSALAGKTSTGKAASALGALTFVNPPRGLTYAVH